MLGLTVRKAATYLWVMNLGGFITTPASASAPLRYTETLVFFAGVLALAWTGAARTSAAVRRRRREGDAFADLRAFLDGQEDGR